MAKKRHPDNFAEDYNLWFDESFNKAIRAIFKVLPQVSPVYTGYFASSWKVTAGATAQAASRAIRKETQKVSDRNRRFKSPWAEVYNDRNAQHNAYFSGKTGKVKPRFIDIPYVDYQATPVVNIGNVVAYAAYALENPSVATYVQGQLKGDLDRAFKTTPQNVRFRIATDPAARQGYVSYTELF